MLFDELEGEAPDLADFDFDGANFDFHSANENLFEDDAIIENRYIVPPKPSTIKVDFAHAEKLAAEVEITAGSRHLFVVTGNFIFGDFIEALIMDKIWLVKNLSISSLGISENNIDSFAGMIRLGYIESIDLILSSYFFIHERYGMLKYVLKELDKDDRLQIAIAATHTKIALIETECGKFITIQGSANLRSSSSIETFCIDEGRVTYDFYKKFHDEIIYEYKIINKPYHKKFVTQKQLKEVIIKKIKK